MMISFIVSTNINQTVYQIQDINQQLQLQGYTIIQNTQMIQQPRVEAEQKQNLEYYDPTSQPYQYKIFINQANGYIGSQLLEVFRNDDQIQVNPNIICGTVDPSIKTLGQLAIASQVSISNKKLFNSVLKKSDIIIYTLDKQSAKQFQYLLKYLRKTNHEGSVPQRLVCVSSFITWNGKRGSFDVSPSLDNLSNRNSSETYLMQLENMCLDINNLNIGVQTFVVCSGLIYGNGQNQLFSYFKRALEQSENLKIYGSGFNYIPTIHIQDLCNTIRDIAFTGYIGKDKRDRVALPKKRYYFAVDKSTLTQQELVKCIAENLGNGQTQNTPIQNVLLLPNFDEMTINCRVTDIPPLENWHSAGGLLENIEKIVSQFNLYRGLKPNKVMILGPPAAGKSKIAEILQKAYGLPVLTVKRVLDELQNEENEFATQIKIKLQQIKAQKIEEQRKVFQQAKKKKKGKKDAGDEFDPSKIVPRLPDDQLLRVFKKRLQKSDCLNKGYILDGWPKTAKTCEALFTNQNKQVNEAIFPNSVFHLNASQDEVKERVKNLPQSVRQTTHWNEQGTARRFQTYIKHNQQGSPKSFFSGRVDIKQIAFKYEGNEQFVQFIERNGPLGFKKKEKVVEIQKKEAPEESKNQVKDENANQQPQDEQHERQPNGEEAQFDIEKLTEHEKEILNEKSRPIRQYLIDNVIPQITEGLLQICKETPRDPIAFLIKFLENKQAVKRSKKK